MKMWSRNTIICTLLLCAWLSAASMAQTFQYSRGWTNGKRSSQLPLGNSAREDDGLQEFFEAQQDGERKLEKCLLQLERLVHNPLWRPAAFTAAAGTSLPLNFNALNAAAAAAAANSNSNGNINSNNKPFGSHHQSNELYEELNTLEPSDYVKH